METIQEGTADIRFTHPDVFRDWVRQHKRREMVEKLLSEREVLRRDIDPSGIIIRGEKMRAVA